METITAIHTRRSIRQYTVEPVSGSDLRVLLEAAMIAPSAGNQQAWHFVVIDERALLDRIPSVHPYAGMAAKAPLAIMVCGDLSRLKYPVDYWVQDCAASTQNIMLAATALGLGSVWCGVHPVPERVEGLRKILNLPANFAPMSLIVIGHPAQEAQRLSRFDEAKVHRNSW